MVGFLGRWSWRHVLVDDLYLSARGAGKDPSTVLFVVAPSPLHRPRRCTCPADSCEQACRRIQSKERQIIVFEVHEQTRKWKIKIE